MFNSFRYFYSWFFQGLFYVLLTYFSTIDRMRMLTYMITQQKILNRYMCVC